MLIYTEHVTPRLTYTLSHIFNTYLGVQYKIITDAVEFDSSNLSKINYSNIDFELALQILPQGLLFENIINKTKPKIEYHNKIPIIFKQKKGNIPFDLFSAVFWFLSRYEEYQQFTPDAHQRFAATESFVYKNNLLNRPIVDEWLVYFKEVLENYFSGIKLKQNKFSAITTIDVDSPWCYKNKGFFRNMAGFIRDIIKTDFSYVNLRIKVLLNKIPDPWYNFQNIESIYKNTDTELMFFIHTGNYGRYDKTVNYKLKAFVNFVKGLGNKAEIGLHPSYKAANNKNIFKDEINRLSEITDRKVIKNRQHFLKFTIPAYYLMLIELGIEQDYSMGFPDKPGFRAGISEPFRFFDLANNKETNLLIHPFAVMDRSLNTYEGQLVDNAFLTIKDIIESVREVNGTFISLWHNESLSNRFEWEGWLAVFNKMTDYLEQQK